MLPLILLVLCLDFTLAGKRSFTLDLSWKTGSPDGFERHMIFVNDGFPGPTLVLHQGDDVEVLVVNNLPDETTVHFHGIEQYGTPSSDGVPGLTQNGIPPGGSFTYKWTATQYGSYMYHAHSRDQIDDGLYGAITIHPRKDIAKPFDKIPGDIDYLIRAEANVVPLILSDWRHRTAQESWDIQVASGVESSACMDSLLVNGKGATYCWQSDEIEYFTNSAVKPFLEDNDLTMTDKGCVPPEVLRLLLDSDASTQADIGAIPDEVFHGCMQTEGTAEVITVSPSKKWAAFAVISPAGIDTFAFSIDQHPMWVYAVDGHYIDPICVHALTIANGERYSFFIELNQPAANYGIRVASVSLSQLIDTTAVLSYEGATENISNPYIDQAGGKTGEGTVNFLSKLETKSYPPQFPQPAPEPDQTFIMTLDTAGSTYQWALNKSPFDANIDSEANPWITQDAESLEAGDTVFKTQNDTWIDLIFKTTTENQPAHPIHKHSNKGFVIGQGEGDFPYSTVADAVEAIPGNFNLVDPPYRDSFATLASVGGPTWTVVRYHVINPGAWLIHCHIQSHIRGGMAAAILDGVDVWPGAGS